MNPKKAFLIGILCLTLLLAGCTSGQVDVTPIVKTLPEVKEFLKQYPGAEIKAVLMTEGAVSANIDNIRRDCEYLPVKSYWKVILKEAEINLTVWMDADSKQPVCVFQKGQEASSQRQNQVSQEPAKVENPPQEQVRDNENKLSSPGTNSGGGAGEGQGSGCYDSDGGKDLFVKGTTGRATGGSTDYCPSEATIFEYTCQDNGVRGHRYYCPSGYVCEEGACVANSVPAEKHESDFTCSDSDGGSNSEVYRNGTVTFCSTVTFSGSGGGGGGRGCGDSEDYCTGNVVTEYACTDSKITIYKYTCPYGCTGGACLKQTITSESCTDSDGGNNYNVSGTITYCTSSISTDIGISSGGGGGGGGGSCSSYSDSCDGNVLTEYDCYDKKPVHQYYTCYPYACSNGACIVSQTTTKTCTDSDGGGNSESTRKGTVTVCTESTANSLGGGGGGGGCVSYTDYCIGNSLMEYHCINGDVNNGTYSCYISDYNCIDGACKYPSTPQNTSNNGSSSGGAGGGGGG